MRSQVTQAAKMWMLLLLLHAACASSVGFLQQDGADYQASWASLVSASHSVALPSSLTMACKAQGTNGGSPPEVSLSAGIVSAAEAQAACDANTACVVPAGATLLLDGSLNVGSLVVRGSVVWTDETQPTDVQWLCAGYVAVEVGGAFNMSLGSRHAYLFIKNNGASHVDIGPRALGAVGGAVRIAGRPMRRTWSLLA
jgi:hypothetical protein